MSESVVLFCGNSPLLLRDVQRDHEGRIKSGDVVNGAWRYERLGNTACAKDGNGFVVNQWAQTAADEREVPVEDYRRGDYNEIINLAKQQLS